MTAPARRGRRALRVVFTVVLLSVVVFPAATWWLFVRPPTGVPDRADAAIVLSGTWEKRVEEGLRLLRTGVVRTVVFVGRIDSPAAADLCDGGSHPDGEVVCLLPEPDNTRTETQAAADLAERRGWRSLVLVTSTHHVSRAGMLLRRCYRGELHVVGTDLPAGIRLTPRLLTYEWGALLRDFVVGRRC
ncbi:MAG: YdcF family protein [Acidimicrobiia bacterium]